MNNIKFSDSELNLMSYQELRKLSILLRLPANIKKKYMISMIQAHQKGDGCTKKAIANKVMEERKIKKLSTKGIQSKPFVMELSTTAQQNPTDLSVSTKHEFETRFSYVAHYTSKDSTNSSISKVYKEDSEVSRRNRSAYQQPRKPTRKLSTMGRTEIMLPRNHSLTTPVRLMPQYERGFVSSIQYETVPESPNSKTHFQDSTAYNYHYHGDYSNGLVPSSNQELQRTEPYWHPREMHNNSLMPILSSLLTTNHASNTVPNFGSPYTAQNTIRNQSSFQQGIYEKYLKNGHLEETQTYSSNLTNATVILNNTYSDNGFNLYDSQQNYIIKRNELDFEVSSPFDDIEYQHHGRKDEQSIIRLSKDVPPYFSDAYLSRNGEFNVNSQIVQHATAHKELSSYEGEFFTNGHEISKIPGSIDPFRKALLPFNSNVKMTNVEVNFRNFSLKSSLPGYEGAYTEEEKSWNEPHSGRNIKNDDWKKSLEKDNFLVMSTAETRSPIMSNASECSDNCIEEINENNDLYLKNKANHDEQITNPSISRCRYICGHNKYPEAVLKKSEVSPILPSFWSTFCTYGTYNKAYSLCGNSVTGTTETHVHPIMTATYASQCTTNSHIVTNSEENSQVLLRPWAYPYSETQSTISVENSSYSSWNEYSNEMGRKFIKCDNGHEVQIVSCRMHGRHYLC